MRATRPIRRCTSAGGPARRIPQRTRARWRALALLTAALLVLHAAVGLARPERVRPGVAYYSDEILLQGGVAELGVERNYEEVFRNFEFYEAWYDADGRVVKCIAYRQGEVLWREQYSYGPDGRPLEKQVTDAQGRTRLVSLR